MHAVCGYPVKSTWLKAIQAGNFVGWPLLTVKNVHKYYPDSAETPQGHLNQTRKNVRSTKPKSAPFEEVHSNQLRGRKVQDIYTTTYQAGNKYIMVMVEIDSSAILVEPIKNRTDAELTRAYSTLMLRLRRWYCATQACLRQQNLRRYERPHPGHLQNVARIGSTGCHRRRAAEVAIRNFKSHFLSILAGVADDFPLKLWDKLLPQTEITLNLLRQSNATPTVSAYAHLNGPFDYNKMPLAPMGCNAQVHEKTDSRGTWAFHSVDGWYVNTSPKHYRTHRCHIKSTNSDQLSDTVHFHHKHITNPTLTPADKLMAAIADCSRVLLTHAPPKGASNLRQLQELLQHTSTRLNLAGPQPPPPHTPHPPPRVEQRIEQPPPRVLDPNMRITRSMTTLPPAIPPVPIPVQHGTSPRDDDTPPAYLSPLSARHTSPNTRSQTAAVAKLAVPPALITRSRASRIPPPTPITKRQTSRLTRMENEVHKALAVLDKSTGKLLNYRQLLRHPVYQGDWTISSANEFGRLAQGVGGRIKGTDTIRFIRKSDIPQDRRKDVTYGRFVCNVRPEKAEPNRTRFTVGGDASLPGEVATPTAEMLTAKLLFNSVISTPGAKFMTMDISNFYLMTPLPRPEYLRLKLSDIPTEIIREYLLDLLAEPDGTIYVLV
eukprot:CCRYP_002334-RA/>CCRYP_002334-RA protein AED:0.29 eAED:0.29 QI:0/0/0/1/1/1/2/0/658